MVSRNPEDNDFAPSSADADEDPLNRRECPHCGLWCRLDEAKPVSRDVVKCPNCDWHLQIV